MKESVIEKYLVRKVKALGGEVRKVTWVGRRNAPDRRVMLPSRAKPFTGRKGASKNIQGAEAFWVELKNPDTIKTFPANAHEEGQAREHKRMRSRGERVEVIGTKDQVDALLA